MKSIIASVLLLVALTVPALAGNIPFDVAPPPPPPDNMETTQETEESDLLLQLILLIVT